MSTHGNEDGFVLVEAIVALAVAAIAAASLMAALNSVGSRAAQAEARSLALRQAQFLIDEAVGSPAAATLTLRGELDRQSWTRSLEGVEAYPGLQRIVVEVTWRSSKQEGRTRLEAYRIAPS